MRVDSDDILLSIGEAGKLMVIRFDSSKGTNNVVKRSICGNVDTYNAVILAQEKQK